MSTTQPLHNTGKTLHLSNGDTVIFSTDKSAATISIEVEDSAGRKHYPLVMTAEETLSVAMSLLKRLNIEVA